jgi:hypothetical protein
MGPKSKQPKKSKKSASGVRAAVARAAGIVPSAVAAAGERVASLKPGKSKRKKAKATTAVSA